MPIKGYGSITVPKDLLQRLKSVAQENHRTVPKSIEHMLDEMYPQTEVSADV